MAIIAITGTWRDWIASTPLSSQSTAGQNSSWDSARLGNNIYLTCKAIENITPVKQALYFGGFVRRICLLNK